MMTFRLIVVALALLACTCIRGPSTVAGGSASEGEARVVGSVVDDASGMPVDNAVVRLRRADFLQDTSAGSLTKNMMNSADLATDNHGGFSIDSIDTGKYLIEINNRHGKAVVLSCNIFSKDTLVDFAPDSVRPSSSIKGVIRTRADSTATVYIQMYGLERIARRDLLTDSFSIADVPSGSYSLRIVSSSPLFSPSTINNVTVQPGTPNRLDTIDLSPFQGWNYSRECICNTTSSGAGVAGDVHNFPVLIRLTSSNFNFSEAKIDGGDLRFAKSDGTLLSYEIERWDSAGGRAEIWVKQDTVYGNDDTHYFTMYWGNSSASSASNGGAVFDTADGFQGVWHLNEATGAAEKDATVNYYNGTPSATAPASVPGMVGTAQRFDGADYFVNMGTVLDVGANNFTISAWLKRAIASTVQAVAGKSNGGEPSATYGYSFAFHPADTLNIAVASGGALFGDAGSFRLKSSITITDTVSWHHVAAVIDKSDNAKCRIFIDGIDRSGSVEGDITTVGALSNSVPFQIGEAADGEYPFTGCLGEVEMAYSARSADWIKLEYMNQKAVDQLVLFK
jgi:hypothetical protein